MGKCDSLTKNVRKNGKPLFIYLRSHISKVFMILMRKRHSPSEDLWESFHVKCSVKRRPPQNVCFSTTNENIDTSSLDKLPPQPELLSSTPSSDQPNLAHSSSPLPEFTVPEFHSPEAEFHSSEAGEENEDNVCQVCCVRTYHLEDELASVKSTLCALLEQLHSLNRKLHLRRSAPSSDDYFG